MRNSESEPNDEGDEYEEMQRHIMQQERNYQHVTAEHGYTEEGIQATVDLFASHIVEYLEQQLPQLSPTLRLSHEQQALMSRISQRVNQHMREFA